MEKKQMTKAQMQRRIEQSPLHLNRTRDFKTIYFDDKGLRLSCDDNEGYCLIETSAHTHVFRSITVAGVSRPYLYTKRFIEIALANDCTVAKKDGGMIHSYAKLMRVLKDKEDKSDYNLCWYVDLWFNNLFSPLYGIGETESEAFLVYERYLRNVARNQVILSEKVNGMTNKQFIKETDDLVAKYIGDMKETEIFKPMTDDEKVKAEVAALSEHQANETMEEQANGEQ